MGFVGYDASAISNGTNVESHIVLRNHLMSVFEKGFRVEAENAVNRTAKDFVQQMVIVVDRTGNDMNKLKGKIASLKVRFKNRAWLTSKILLLLIFAIFFCDVALSFYSYSTNDFSSPLYEIPWFGSNEESVQEMVNESLERWGEDDPSDGTPNGFKCQIINYMVYFCLIPPYYLLSIIWMTYAIAMRKEIGIKGGKIALISALLLVFGFPLFAIGTDAAVSFAFDPFGSLKALALFIGIVLLTGFALIFSGGGYGGATYGESINNGPGITATNDVSRTSDRGKNKILNVGVPVDKLEGVERSVLLPDEQVFVMPSGDIVAQAPFYSATNSNPNGRYRKICRLSDWKKGRVVIVDVDGNIVGPK